MYLTEDGIYCELNLDDCVTYALPIDSTVDTLGPLKHSLDKVKSRLMLQKLNGETSNYSDYNDSINDTSNDTSSNTTTTNNIIIKNTATTITTNNNSDNNNQPLLLGYIMSERANGLDCLQPRLVLLEDTVDTISAETVSRSV